MKRNERERERFAVLMIDLWFMVSTKILMVKFKCGKVMVCMVVEYNPSKGMLRVRLSGTM